jgi:putative ABC transport system permease protein
MTPWRRVWAWWRTLRHGQSLDRDLREEVDAYVSLAEAEAHARGEDPGVARRRVLVEMGAVTTVEEHVREGRPGAWIVQALQDAAHSRRIVRRAPGFTLSVTLTLALAIGATSAMGSIVRTVVMAPLPYPQAEALFRIDAIGYIGEYLEFTQRARTFSPAIYGIASPLTLTGHGDPVRLRIGTASASLFDVLGVRPAMGDHMRDTDHAPGAVPAVWLTDRTWRERFGAHTGLVGQTISLDHVDRRVRGILPSGFAFPDPSIDAWIPATFNPADRVATWSVGGSIIGRLAPGASWNDADAEIRRMAPAFAPLFPWRMPAGYGELATARPLKDVLVGDADRTLNVALAAIGFVFVIACLNVGILLVGRAHARHAELATRAALGASRGRLARQVFVECLVLAAIGGVGAMIVASAAIGAAGQLLPTDVPRVHEISVDGWLLTAVALVTIGAGLIISIVPVWRAWGLVGRPVAGRRTFGMDRSGRRVTRALVALEVALAAVLVVGAGLLVRSLDQLLEVDPGFVPEGIVTAAIAPSPLRYREAAARRDIVQQALTRIAQRPDVTSVAATDRLPFTGVPFGSVFILEGVPDPAQSGEWPYAKVRAIVSPGFFDTLRVPIIRGRTFTGDDTPTSEPVVVINEALARAHWADQDPLGRRVRFPGMAAGQWLRVVGIVADTRWQRMNEEAQSALYLPLAQSEPEDMHLVVRGPNLAVAAAHVRASVHALDTQIPVDQIARLDDRVAAAAGGPRFLAIVFSAFGIVGVVLGAVGLYGVVSDAVGRQRHEFAVRLAIGAEPRGILRLVAWQGATVALSGLVVGLLGAWAGAGLLGSVLFNVPATDPLTFALATLCLVAVVLPACLLPARRASRISPLAALKD